MSKATLAAYLAGSIDADGSFTVRVDRTEANKGNGASPRYVEMISLKQVTPEVPHLLYATFGGCLYLQGPSVTKGRPLWTWHVSAKKAAAAIRVLLPHLRIKGRQARLLIALRARKDAYAKRPNRGVYSHVTPEENAAREQIRANLRAFNRGE